MYVLCKYDSLMKSVVFNKGYLFLIKGMATLLKFNTHNFIFSVENFGWTFFLKKKIAIIYVVILYSKIPKLWHGNCRCLVVVQRQYCQTFQKGYLRYCFRNILSQDAANNNVYLKRKLTL